MTAQSNFKIDGFSGLAAVPSAWTPARTEEILRKEGWSFGLAEGGDKDSWTAYLQGDRVLEPFLKYGDTGALLASLSVRFPDGTGGQTVLAPRSAAGPSLRHLFLGTQGKLAEIEGLTLRVRPVPAARFAASVLAQSVEEAVSVLRAQTQAKNRPALVRLYDPESSRWRVGDGREGCLTAFEYDGEENTASFRLNRMVEAFPGAKPRASVKKRPGSDTQIIHPLFPKPAEKMESEAVLHAGVRWSSLLPLIEALTRSFTGLVPLQWTVSSVWPDAALLSLRLLSHPDDPAEHTLIGSQVQELLATLGSFTAEALEVTPLKGKLTAQVRRVTDPFSERLFENR